MDAAQARVDAQLAEFMLELERWGARINLVGSTSRAEIETHVKDALAGASALAAGARVVDLGSGGGFPGLPLAIARPDVAFVLVEIRERRVHFLRHVVRTLGLGCEVWRQRIEDGPAAGESEFDVATARAVGPAREVVRAARAWVHDAGEVWLWTREEPEDCGAVEGHKLAIDASGRRGHILRIPALAIPRGTSRAVAGS